jgi:hypothetical protein
MVFRSGLGRGGSQYQTNVAFFEMMMLMICIDDCFLPMTFGTLLKRHTRKTAKAPPPFLRKTSGKGLGKDGQNSGGYGSLDHHPLDRDGPVKIIQEVMGRWITSRISQSTKHQQQPALRWDLPREPHPHPCKRPYSLRGALSHRRKPVSSKVPASHHHYQHPARSM